MNTDSILVSVDIAGCADEVVGNATELCAKLGATMTLLHVTHVPIGVDDLDVILTESHPEGMRALDLLDEAARDRLLELAGVARASGVPVQIHVHHGDPAGAVLRCAEEVDAGLIVVGTHGRTGLSRLLMGSVAEQIIRSASVPVVVVRTLAPETHPGLSPAARQLLAEGDG